MPPWSSVIPTHLISDKATHVRTVLPLVKENHRSPSRHIKEAGYFTVDKLDCSAHGGPSDASEMVYWRNIPEDRTRTFTFSNATAEQFVTFEPDEGGFNNIRMSFETVVVLTMAMGRTLVLPPMQEMYLLGESVNSTQRTRFSFSDFYPLDEIARDYPALRTISMEQFLTQHRDLLIAPDTYEPSAPPDNRVDWNGASKEEIWHLHQWLRLVGKTPQWVPNECVVGFAQPHRLQRLANKVKRVSEMKPRKRLSVRKHNPVPPNGIGGLRLAEIMAHRTSLCEYNKTWQTTPVIHFTGSIESGTRMLIHFYSFLFFAEWSVDLWFKRFVRDRLRYRDEIQCKAAQIVENLRARSGDRGFDTLHIRRGDFKVNKTLLTAEQIYENIADVLGLNSTIYIATDERNISFFSPFLTRHKVYFLSDFEEILSGVNTNFFGLIEQLVVARGRTFVGCMFSTFSGFCHRLRGYYSTLEEWPGHEDGKLVNSYYYAPLRSKDIMLSYAPFSKPLHSREFPIAWKDIDFDLENPNATAVSYQGE